MTEQTLSDKKVYADWGVGEENACYEHEDVKEAVRKLKDGYDYDDIEDKVILDKIDKIFGEKLI